VLDLLLKRLKTPEAKPRGHDDLAIAVGVLLIEAARMDDTFGAEERGVVERLLAKKFHLGTGETRELLARAEQTAKQSAQLHPFTRRTVTDMSPEERVHLIEMLWEVAYADGVLDAEEDNLLRRIAGLIYVPDEERVAARLRVMERLGLR
jgi:uncharacterized tellurite resistance protein B-like protein